MITKQISAILPADRMENVRYAIRDLAVLAEDVARQGHKILYLNIGDPCKYDFPTPPHMVEAVHKAMLDGRNGYADSLGIKPAVECIRSRRGEARLPKTFRAFSFVTAAGRSIDSCLTALVNPGDNVLTPSPEYPLYGAVLAKLGAVTNAYDLDEANGWEPDARGYRAQDQSRTKAIILINPNNPTGAVYSKKTLERSSRSRGEHNLIIFADEIYDKLIIDAGCEALSRSRRWRRTFHALRSTDFRRHILRRVGESDGRIATGPAEVLAPYLEGVHRLLRARLSAPHPFQHGHQAGLGRSARSSRGRCARSCAVAAI